MSPFLVCSLTVPTVAALLTLSMKSSFGLMGSTTSVSFAPTTLVRRCGSSLSVFQSGGSFPGWLMTAPTSLSLLTMLGSSCVRMELEPPGLSSFTGCPPAISPAIVVLSGFHTFWFFSSVS